MATPQNFRDVGTSLKLNNFSLFRLQEGLLYRSGGIKDLSRTSAEQFQQKYSFRALICLDGPPSVMLKGKVAGIPLTPRFEDNMCTRQTFGLVEHEISLYSPELLADIADKLSWTERTKIHYRVYTYCFEAVMHIVNKQFAAWQNQQSTVQQIGTLLKRCKAQFKAIFAVFVDPENFPVLIHDKNGRHFTGWVVCLLSMLCGVDPDAIQADYMRSDAELEGRYQEFVSRAKEFGRSEDSIRCVPDFAAQMQSMVRTEFGSIEGLMASLGVSREDCDKIRGNLSSSLDDLRRGSGMREKGLSETTKDLGWL